MCMGWRNANLGARVADREGWRGSPGRRCGFLVSSSSSNFVPVTVSPAVDRREGDAKKRFGCNRRKASVDEAANARRSPARTDMLSWFIITVDFAATRGHTSRWKDPAGNSQRVEVPLGIPSGMWNCYQIPLEILSGWKSRWEFSAGCGTVIRSRWKFPAGVRIRASCELKPAKGYVSDVAEKSQRDLKNVSRPAGNSQRDFHPLRISSGI